VNYELTPGDIEDFGRQTELPHESQRKFLLQHKVPTPEMSEADYRRQAMIYAEGIFEGYRRLFGQPVLVNKLRGRATQTLFSLNDLIHPETIEAMTPETPGCGCVR